VAAGRGQPLAIVEMERTVFPVLVCPDATAVRQIATTTRERSIVATVMRQAVNLASTTCARSSSLDPHTVVQHCEGSSLTTSIQVGLDVLNGEYHLVRRTLDFVACMYSSDDGEGQVGKTEYEDAQRMGRMRSRSYSRMQDPLAECCSGDKQLVCVLHGAIAERALGSVPLAGRVGDVKLEALVT
jgi:hypothetical protein